MKPAPTIEDKVSLNDIGQKKDPPKTENRKPKTPSLLGLEVGVGSGAVVIALAKELDRMAWVGLDRSGAALAVARDNARRHGIADRVHFLRSNLLAALKPTAAFALLVANLPYVPRAEWNGSPERSRRLNPPGPCWGAKTGWT